MSLEHPQQGPSGPSLPTNVNSSTTEKKSWYQKLKAAAKKLKREVLAVYYAMQDPRTSFFAKIIPFMVRDRQQGRNGKVFYVGRLCSACKTQCMGITFIYRKARHQCMEHASNVCSFKHNFCNGKTVRSAGQLLYSCLLAVQARCKHMCMAGHDG